MEGVDYPDFRGLRLSFSGAALLALVVGWALLFGLGAATLASAGTVASSASSAPHLAVLQLAAEDRRAVVRFEKDGIQVVGPGDSLRPTEWGSDSLGSMTVVEILPDRLVIEIIDRDSLGVRRRAWVYRSEEPDQPSRIRFLDPVAPSASQIVSPAFFEPTPVGDGLPEGAHLVTSVLSSGESAEEDSAGADREPPR